MKNPAPKQAYNKNGGKPPAEADIGQWYRATPRAEVKEAAKALMQQKGVYAPAPWAKRWGIVVAGYLAHFVYFAGRQKSPDGYIYKSAREVEEEIGITRAQQETARKTLVRDQVIQTKTGGIGNKVHVRVNLPFLALMDDMPSAEDVEAREDDAPPPGSAPDKAPERAGDGARPVARNPQSGCADPAKRFAEKPQPVARNRQTHNRNTAVNTTETPSPPNEPGSVVETGRAQQRPRGEEGVDQVKVGKCVGVLLTTKGMPNRPDPLRDFITDRMREYPFLDPLAVCRRYRDHVAGMQEPVRFHSRYLAGFFEREEGRRVREPKNPHGPEGARFASKPKNAGYYLADEIDALETALKFEGKSHAEIEAAVQGLCDAAR